jgi:hypothetical protein
MSASNFDGVVVQAAQPAAHPADKKAMFTEDNMVRFSHYLLTKVYFIGNYPIRGDSDWTYNEGCMGCKADQPFDGLLFCDLGEGGIKLESLRCMCKAGLSIGWIACEKCFPEAQSAMQEIRKKYRVDAVMKLTQSTGQFKIGMLKSEHKDWVIRSSGAFFYSMGARAVTIRAFRKNVRGKDENIDILVKDFFEANKQLFD